MDKGAIKDSFWEAKVQLVVKISKENGFSEQDYEFWILQPAGIISLVVDLYSRIIPPCSC